MMRRACSTMPDALVRGAAVWALSQLMDRDAFDELADARLPLEGHISVPSDEWRARS